MASFSETLGLAIQTNRKAAGLSRVQLADLAGVGKTAVFDVEHGKPTVRLNTLLVLMDALNMSLKIEAPVEVDHAEG